MVSTSLESCDEGVQLTSSGAVEGDFLEFLHGTEAMGGSYNIIVQLVQKNQTE